MDSVAKKILVIVNNHPSVEGKAVALEADFREDLCLDSLVLAEITVEIEDEFDIRFKGDALAEIRTVGDVVELAAGLLGGVS